MPCVHHFLKHKVRGPAMMPNIILSMFILLCGITCLIIIKLTFLWFNIKEYQQNIKNEYWLYYVVDFKKWARLFIEYMILAFIYGLLCSYASTSVDSSKIFDVYKISFPLVISFLSFILVRHPIIIDPAAKEIDDSLRILRKTVILLDIGKKFIESATKEENNKIICILDTSKLLNNSLLSYIRNELDKILLIFSENKLNFKLELEFIFDIIQININSFNKCLVDLQSTQNMEEDLFKFISYYDKLLLIHRYFLYKQCTEDYKKYFFYTFKDIKKIRSIYKYINLKSYVEILQIESILIYKKISSSKNLATKTDNCG